MKNLNIVDKKLDINYELDDLINKNSHLILAFQNAPFRIKTQILSLVSQNYKEETIIEAFGATQWLVKSSRKHEKDVGLGIPYVSETKLNWITSI